MDVVRWIPSVKCVLDSFWNVVSWIPYVKSVFDSSIVSGSHEL